MFTRAIVRTPAATLTEGISTAGLGKPDYALALKQHKAYIEALRACKVEVFVLDADPAYPDSCFVEDTAVLAERVAVIDNPGAPSRKGEEHKVEAALRRFYPEDQIEHITSPGTLEGGDVLRVGDYFYVGLSERTNRAGAQQLLAHLRKHGYDGCTLEVNESLHLKSGVAYLENNRLLVAGEWIDHPAFAEFEKIVIHPDEAYAANSLWVNKTVLIPAGYPAMKRKLQEAGMNILEVDTSEYRKLDGGLSCLSLRW
jgi:dimethylargininase